MIQQRAPALVLIVLILATAAACGTSAPQPTAAAASPPRTTEAESSYDEADAIYRRGYVEAAMKRWGALTDSPAAKARLAILENRPEAALAIPMSDDVRLLKAQARAALMLGDVDAGGRVLAKVKTIPGTEPFAAELDSWVAAARLGRSSRVARVVSEASATVPFVAPEGVPLIDVRFGDRTERFLFDSGADISIVDTRAAARLGVRLPAEAGTRAVTIAGTMSASEGIVDRMEILGLALEDVPVGVTDFGPLAEWKIAGVLSLQQLFRRDVVTIDYAGKRITRSRQSRPEGWPMVFVNGKLISVRGSLKGGPEGLFQIETGVDTALITSVYLQVARALHAPFDVGPPFEKTHLGIGGGRMGTARRVTGSAFCASGESSCFDLREVLAWDPTAATAESLTGVEHVGVFGTGAFEGRVLELDYPALRVRVRTGD